MIGRRFHRHGISLIEVACLLLIIGGCLAILLPGLDVSREEARMNVCSRNVRRFDLATAQYLAARNVHRLTSAGSWPTTLRPYLEQLIGVPHKALGQEILTAPRPVYLTCPSHMYQPPLTVDNVEVCHYVLVSSDAKPGKPGAGQWYFQDQMLNAPPNEVSPWYLSSEITPAVAEQRISQRQGPHLYGSFVRSNSKGETWFAPEPDGKPHAEPQAN